MNTRILNLSLFKSLALHAILVLMVFLYSILTPRFEVDSISILLMEPETTMIPPAEKKYFYPSDRNRVAKEDHSGKGRSVSVSDLGVKINGSRSRPDEIDHQRWASNSLGEAVAGDQYFHGLKNGETTALNTKEYIYFTYIARIHHQLDQIWQPLIRREIEKYIYSGRQLASEIEFVSNTRITINAKGEIVKVFLVHESGVLALDSTALSALNKAGPYPNPPKGLLDEYGFAQLHWDFILKN